MAAAQAPARAPVRTLSEEDRRARVRAAIVGAKRARDSEWRKIADEEAGLSAVRVLWSQRGDTPMEALQNQVIAATPSSETSRALTYLSALNTQNIEQPMASGFDEEEVDTVIGSGEIEIEFITGEQAD